MADGRACGLLPSPQEALRGPLGRSSPSSAGPAAQTRCLQTGELVKRSHLPGHQPPKEVPGPRPGPSATCSLCASPARVPLQLIICILYTGRRFLNGGVFWAASSSGSQIRRGVARGSGTKLAANQPVTCRLAVGFSGKTWLVVGHSGTIGISWGAGPQDDLRPAPLRWEQPFPWASWDGDTPGSHPPWPPSVPHLETPALSWRSLWKLASAQLPARPWPMGLYQAMSSHPHPVAACTSALLECVCLSDVCIFGALENSIFAMRQMKKNDYGS